MSAVEPARFGPCWYVFLYFSTIVLSPPKTSYHVTLMRAEASSNLATTILCEVLFPELQQLSHPSRKAAVSVSTGPVLAFRIPAKLSRVLPAGEGYV